MVGLLAVGLLGGCVRWYDSNWVPCDRSNQCPDELRCVGGDPSTEDADGYCRLADEFEDKAWGGVFAASTLRLEPGVRYAWLAFSTDTLDCADFSDAEGLYAHDDFVLVQLLNVGESGWRGVHEGYCLDYSSNCITQMVAVQDRQLVAQPYSYYYTGYGVDVDQHEPRVQGRAWAASAHWDFDALRCEDDLPSLFSGLEGDDDDDDDMGDDDSAR